MSRNAFDCFGTGFLKGSKNFLVIRWRFLLKIGQGILFFLVLVLNGVVFKLVLGDFDWYSLFHPRILLEYFMTIEWVVLLSLIVGDLLIGLIYLLFYVTFMTGVRAAIADYDEEGETISLINIFSNQRKYFTRSFNINLTLGIYVLLYLVILILLLTLSTLPMLYLENFWKK